MSDFTVIVKEPRGECQFCEHSKIHPTGYGYVCLNTDGILYGKHITTEYRGQDSGCKVWELFYQNNRRKKE